MRKRRDLGQPSDIAFLLIIFFLLLAGINTTQSISLHTNTSDSIQSDPTSLQALLTRQGTIVVEDHIYSPLSFARELSPNTTLHLKVEAETSWQQVVDLLSLTEQRQIAGLSLTAAETVSPTLSSERIEKVKIGASTIEKNSGKNEDEKIREMAP